jgi:hypothetical protein
MATCNLEAALLEVVRVDPRTGSDVANALRTLPKYNDMTSAIACRYHLRLRKIIERGPGMEEAKDPLHTLAGRCVGPAWDALKALRKHPNFPALIERLTAINGTVLRHDVEQAFREVVDPQAAKK